MFLGRVDLRRVPRALPMLAISSGMSHPGSSRQPRGSACMADRFEYVPDVDRGEWLRLMEAEPFSSVGSVVPRGYERYARVFHPAVRDRPSATQTWHGFDEATYFNKAADLDVLLESEHSTWRMIATAFDTTMHPEAQSARLLRSKLGEVHSAIGHDGWRYSAPDEGNLDVGSLAALARVLARHTETPDAGVAAIWEGWGGLVSSAGAQLYIAEGVESSPVADKDEIGVWRTASRWLRRRLMAAARLQKRAVRSIKWRLPTLARNEPKPGSGLFSAEIATGPRLDLHGGTGRSYVLFDVSAEDLADPGWTARAPWVDEPHWAQSPSILWPDDHSWVLASEIDYDSTLIAGTKELISELLLTPGLEVLPIRMDADLTWDGDAINGPR